MRFKRVLLVSPPTSSYLGASRPPQNLGYLAQALLESEIDYDILDMRLGYNMKHLQKKIALFSPELIGVTMVSLEYKKTYDLISYIKKLDSNIKIVVGGPHVTALQEKVLQDCSSIDYGVVYEGEETLVELCQEEKSETEIKGLIRREDNRVVYNGHRVFQNNLDEISFPAYNKFELKKYIKEIPLNSSRGCPFRCVFCPNKLITKKFRWRSAKNVVNEIEYWYNSGYRIFNFDDDNFGFFRERVYEICDEIETRGINEAEFRCSNGLRADRVDRDQLKRMREVGFNYIAFGVDGGNNKMLKINKKGETIEEIEHAIKNACDLGFSVKLFCVIGMPQETKKDIEDSLAIIQKYPIQRVYLNNPIPYPGTELYELIERNGWFLQQPEKYLNAVSENVHIPVFETPELTREDRIHILKLCRKIEKKVTREAVKRMYKKFLFVATLAGYFFATDFMQRMFFKNMLFRKFIERIRYKRMLATRI